MRRKGITIIIIIFFSIFIYCIYFYTLHYADSYVFCARKSNCHYDRERRLENGIRQREKHSIRPVTTFDILMVFAKITVGNSLAKERFQRTITSLVRRSRLPITLHIILDKEGRIIVDDVASKSNFGTGNIIIRFYDIGIISKKIMRRLDRKLLNYFRYNSNSYYGDPLFFLSLVAADLFPGLKRCVKIDADLLFRTDVGELWDYFDRFTPLQLFGFVLEQQPVYRHVFRNYRSSNKSTKIGDPPPDGLTGFNSGVIMMDLEKIRSSPTYLDLIRLENIQRLASKYKFQGHLGDQDIYTLLSIQYPQLFFTLPCEWNRQLCQWWRKSGYADVFDQYFNCEKPIKIYHGNCDTAIPELND